MVSKPSGKVILLYPLVLFAGTFLVLNLAFPLRINIEYSPIILSADSTLLSGYLTSDDKWRMYTTLEEITPTLRKTIIHKEDRFFYYHPGINPLAVVRAAFNNIFAGKRTSGASTITMQVARLLQPKKRTYLNKFIEVFRAFQLEIKYTKDEILQLYLNLVPYGGNIEGVKSASILYFDKMPDHLSLAEATALSIIPNRPTTLRLGINNKLIKEERDHWLRRYLKDGVFEKEAIVDAIDEPVIASRSSIIRRAPHLSQRLKNSNPLTGIVYTSLDLDKQMKTEHIVRNYINRIYNRNIHNAAVLVVDNRTLQVKSYVGSANYEDPKDGGQVDGIRAIRSPGSTLKPLLYGLAIDKGLITPGSIISDVPVNFRGYQPRNYNEDYNGNVTMTFALANSLNIPAVKILHLMQPRKFIDALAYAGFKQISRDRDHLGLSTVLGGCGVSLEELTRLYAGFAHHGQSVKLNYSPFDTVRYDHTILTGAASYMIAEILTDVVRPDLPLVWKNTRNLPKVAWKTGTSYGRRDAWSIGFNKNYTIGVWVGNFSGEGVPELTGTDMAAPLLFKLFNTIDREASKDWFKMPKGINFRYVCSETGLVPNEFCTSQTIDYFIPGISDYRKCQHLKYVHVAPDSSHSYCMTCMPEAGYVKALYPNYSPEILSYFDDQKINYIKIPPHDESCERVFTSSAPKITSPIDQLEYFVDKTDTMQIALNCQSANNVNEVFWYVNHKFYRSALANETIYFTPGEGDVNISCTDDKGRNSDIAIKVKKIRF